MLAIATESWKSLNAKLSVRSWWSDMDPLCYVYDDIGCLKYHYCVI